MSLYQNPEFDTMKSDGGLEHLQYGLYGAARTSFIKKVYSILTMQLAITFMMCLVSYNVPEFLQFQINNQWLMWVCLAVMIVVEISILCCSFGRQSPTNLILLLIFTLTQSYFVSFICSMVAQSDGPEVVVIAASMTLGIFIALTTYAIFTKRDFSTKWGILVVIVSAFILLTFISIFSRSPFLNNFLCTLGVIIFGIYIVIDTQLIIGGRKYELGMDDYVIGALLLYIDIIQMFLYILQLLSNKK